MWCATLLLAVAHISLNAAIDPRYADDLSAAFVFSWIAALIAFQAFATVGAVVASRMPVNPIGWMFCLSALLCQLANGGGAYVDFAYDHGLPGDVVASIVVGPTWFMGAYLGVIAPLYFFPNGKPLTRRWRPVAAVAVVWPMLFALSSFVQSGKLDLHPTRRNPLGIDAARYLFAFVLPLLAGLVLLALVSLILRYRRSRGSERQQLRVYVVTTVIVVSTFVVIAVGSGLGPLGHVLGAFGDFVILWLIALVPISMGVAILRYRLYDFDRVVSRTIVYAALTLVLGAAYVGLVLAGQALFASFAGGSNLAIAVSTLVVAALFLPVRARVQRVVDRRFNRRRYDAERTLELFGARLRDHVELDGLTSDLAGVVAETVQPSHVGLWLRRAP